MVLEQQELVSPLIINFNLDENSTSGLRKNGANYR